MHTICKVWLFQFVDNFLTRFLQNSHFCILHHQKFKVWIFQFVDIFRRETFYVLSGFRQFLPARKGVFSLTIVWWSCFRIWACWNVPRFAMSGMRPNYAKNNGRFSRFSAPVLHQNSVCGWCGCNEKTTPKIRNFPTRHIYRTITTYPPKPSPPP